MPSMHKVAGVIIFALGITGMALVLIVVLNSTLSRPATSAVTVFGLFATIVGIGIPLAMAIIGRRLMVGERAEPPPPRPRPVPQPVVTQDDLEGVPVPITACPECGFLGVRMPTIHDGLWPGGGELTDRVVCTRCDWQGLPARFDTHAEYRAFLRALAQPEPAGESAPAA